MILHLYHCALAVIRDYKTSGGRNRPDGTGKWPDHANEADVEFLPPTGGFDDVDLGRLLELFQRIDLDEPELDSPVWVNWAFLERKLGLSRERVTGLMHKARDLGLLQRLTIDYDHERWLRHSRVKGCLVIMACVEEADLERDKKELAQAVQDVIDDEVRSPPPGGLLAKGDELSHVFVVPNGHLNPRSGLGVDWKGALPILQEITKGLEERGYEAQLSSYGYEKLIQLAINAHKRGYMLRVV